MKKYIIAVSLIALAFAGYAAADHVTTTEQHVVVFDPPPITSTIVDTDQIPHETTTVVSTETVTVTVTNPPPTTTTTPDPTTSTEPPTTTTEPDPPDPPVGTVINLLNERFVCRGPLSELGDLPIIIEQHLTNTHISARNARGAIAYESGCQGDGNAATIDLVIHQYGNGTTLGAAGDPIVVFPGSHDVNATGFTQCGTIYPGADGIPRTSDDAHQDGVDGRGGLRNTWENYDIGIWDTLTATCQGAGALMYWSAFLASSSPNDNPALLQDFLCIRCRFVASKEGRDPSAGPAGRGGFIVQSMRSGAINSCFAGFLPFQIRPHAPPVNGAISPIDINNVKIDTNDSIPDDPDLCEIER